MKIAVGALRLTEWHLHVNSQSLHRTKTLAHLSQLGGPAP
jgi:hypothetical protein